MATRKRRDAGRRCALVALGVLGCALLLAPPARADASRQDGGATPAAQTAQPGFVGVTACVSCHEAQAQTYHGSAMGRARDPRTPAAEQGCETCHGPGQKHVDDPGDKTSIRNFLVMSPREVSATCVRCHNREQHAEWQGSMHDSRNLTCITCHSMHSPKSERAQLKKVTITETCGQCHRDKTMRLLRAGHMPVREGKMECTTCHNQHGSTNVRLLRTGNTVNEFCVNCHAEKRGPFLWEHAPVRENCTTCHDPHGASNDRMLVSKAPMLCQRCHVSSRHPATIYDAVAVTSRNSRIIGRACLNCHPNIHGSNHPSGNTFQR